ncbi:TIRAP isoform 5 [Pan troglodytes]|uniref:TIR domain containing adaptor protein n=2 Tax=Homininae TaxID=207598 RepID=F5H2K1_HUMAN|nr:TIR domain containing adaptor protein [Homo sapiens]KAI4074850.1 TIR domain containing adaptor protein [Homo sapiens]PNI65552.1 TIRAP isoform 5 [Pan troglodytes]
MASSTSLPAPGSRPKKPLGKMADWFRQTLLKKPKKRPGSLTYLTLHYLS